jgi:O-antigen chain-terminating methyltransferase
VIRTVVPERWRARVYYQLSGEEAAIKAEMKGASGKPWSTFDRIHRTVGMDERIVEIPWVLSRYRGEGRVLDVGTVNAVPLYLRYLRGLGIPELHGVDLSEQQVKGIHITQADVRQMPFPDASFDLALCVSTLEHIGYDNTSYGVATAREQGGDVAALTEIRRVLNDHGRLLLTVPFGRFQEYGWFRQYDLETWRELLRSTGFEPVEEAFYGYSPQGWAPVADPSALHSAGFREHGAPASTGVLCADLRISAR